MMMNPDDEDGQVVMTSVGYISHDDDDDTTMMIMFALYNYGDYDF